MTERDRQAEIEAVVEALDEADLHLHTRMDSISVRGAPAQEIAEDILAALDAVRGDTVKLADVEAVVTSLAEIVRRGYHDLDSTGRYHAAECRTCAALAASDALLAGFASGATRPDDNP